MKKLKEVKKMYEGQYADIDIFAPDVKARIFQKFSMLITAMWLNYGFRNMMIIPRFRSIN